MAYFSSLTFSVINISEGMLLQSQSMTISTQQQAHTVVRHETSITPAQHSAFESLLYRLDSDPQSDLTAIALQNLLQLTPQQLRLDDIESEITEALFTR